MQAEDSQEHGPIHAASTSDHAAVQYYEIRVDGHLHTRWAAWFDGMTLTNSADGTTLLRGPIVDQAFLHGALQKLRDIGTPLISVTQVEPDGADPETRHVPASHLHETSTKP